MTFLCLKLEGCNTQKRVIGSSREYVPHVIYMDSAIKHRKTTGVETLKSNIFVKKKNMLKALD